MEGALNYKSILCTDIPELFLDKFVARTHFGRFGNLVNFVLRPSRMTCTVSYATEDEAELALHEGNVYNGHEFHMTYAENETAPAQKTEQWVDPEVQAELNALSGGWPNEYQPSKSNKLAAEHSGNRSQPSQSQAQAHSERRERPPLPPPAHSKAYAQELEAVMCRPAHTSEEKYRVLDARDKLLRLNQQLNRQLDLQWSGSTQGYCPDMCPEKERLLREFQRQVSVFEMQPDSLSRQPGGLICHELALKQYSRSSADQETPLPHELRGESALHMTMSYLMHEIMDINREPLGDWFHFVWDRTRSIRKEITQQELCSLGAVKLVEQCARFHIHCAGRLVAEDPSVFDSKINADNLTKCLQTLKYMYHDLRLKGVQCPREAEFRGYIVLLNLADANFLWDVGQLPAELQTCPEIRQAIQFYLSLQDTNFVRFFQLLKHPETSYLSACILVRYFTRLRVLALHRLIQGYRAPRKNEVSSLPLAYVTQMLACESQQEAAHFVQHYGLEINQDSRVVLTRMDNPEVEYKLERQLELVESKRYQSVGECICGEPLPPKSLYRSHRPHDSFNAHQMLKRSAWSAKDQMPNQEPEEESLPPQRDSNLFKVPMQPAAASAGGFSFSLPKSRAQEMQEMQEAAAVAQAEQQRQQHAQRAQEEARMMALQQAIAAAKQREAELMALQAAKAAEAERVRQQREQEQEAELLRRRHEQEAEQQRRQQQAQQMQETLYQQDRQRREQQHLELQQRKSRLEIQSHRLYEQLFEETLHSVCAGQLMLEQRAHRYFDQTVDSITGALVERELQKSIYEMSLMRIYWRRWRDFRRVQQQKDTLFNQLPLSFGAENPERLVNERCVEDSLRLMRRYRQGEACNYNQLLTGMGDRGGSLKLDLWKVLGQYLPQELPDARRYYKLLLSLPEGEDGLKFEYNLDRGLLQRQPLQLTADEPNAGPESGGYIRGVGHGVALSVLKTRAGQDPSSWAQADGIVCFASFSNLQEIPPRLRSLIQESRCALAALVLQYPKHATAPIEEELAQWLQLDQLGLQSWRIFCLRAESASQRTQLMSVLQSALKFLAQQPQRTRDGLLRQAEMRGFLVNNLGPELFRRLRHAAFADQTIRCKSRESPQFCVELYNEAVRRLQVVAGEDLQHCIQFPQDLRPFVERLSDLELLPTSRLEYFEPGWEQPEQRCRIVQLLELAKLPPMQSMPAVPSRIDQHEDYCQWLLEYVQLSQQEDLVESICLHAIGCLEREPDFLGLTQLLAMERLQFVLRREPQLPKAIVIRDHTMKHCFQSSWYYDFQQPEPGSPEPPVAAPEPAPPKEVLDFDEIVSNAERVLSNCAKRTEQRRRLRELNAARSLETCSSSRSHSLEACSSSSRSRSHSSDTSYTSESSEHPQQKYNDAENCPKRQRRQLDLI
ncbi:protein xmas-2 [Drosophila obscura]|uniref:protein xmas-2 n=1 Tax=Drosophila obscura TaxID=7282 RepID=UPI001BB1973A|nr:protein xmas-2 [Drosophila obscura]